MLTSEIKQYTISNGADICGIASADRFAGAPDGYNPTYIFKECREKLSDDYRET